LFSCLEKNQSHTRLQETQAVHKAVEFVPHMPTLLGLTEISVTEQHWSVRQQGAAVQE
jgi:hypothetical protein